LIAEGALIQAPNRSFQVIPMTPDRLVELTRVRVALDGMAARLATTNADQQLVETLTRLNAEMREAIEPTRADDVLRANQEFHFTIYRAAKSPQLLELIDMLWLRSGPYLADMLRGRADAQEIFRRGTVVHGRLIRAMARRDADGVARALTLDLERTAEFSMKHLAAAALRPRGTAIAA
jgi:DNA-binding GntR family transcriptional regulator